MQSSSLASIATLLLALNVAAASTSFAQDAKRASFVETYVAKGRGGLKMRLQLLKPLASLLEAEKRGPVSGGRYTVENGVLTICMLSLPPGAYRNVLEMAVPGNYTLCAPMKAEGT